MKTYTGDAGAAEFIGNRFLTAEARDREFPTDGMSAIDAMRLVGEELALEGRVKTGTGY